MLQGRFQDCASEGTAIECRLYVRAIRWSKGGFGLWADREVIINLVTQFP
jgi:hypothetical protein